METTVERLEGNRVRLRIAVDEAEFDRALDAAFRKLAREVRIPGFRPGKAPRRLLEAQLGSGAARDQALRDALPEYYARALLDHDVDAIAPPDIEITGGQEEGAVEFEALVEVRPEVELSGYEALRVEIPFSGVDDELVDAQVDQLRERFAELVDSDEPLVDGAYATIDVRGSRDEEELEGLVATDFLYEVGSGLLVPELDEELRGAKPGAILKFSAELPERFGDRAGEEVEFSVVVKEAQTKVLPDLTDEWVRDASEFDAVDDLRADVRGRMLAVATAQARMLVRDRVLEAVADLVPVEAPTPLVDQETQRRLHDLVHRLEHQNADLAQYLQATGRDESSLVAEVREGAIKAVLADLALRAVAAHEGLGAEDAEVDAEIERLAAQVGEKPTRVRRDLERGGGIEAVRSEIARAKALELLVERATVVDEHGDEVDLEGVDLEGVAASVTDADDETPTGADEPDTDETDQSPDGDDDKEGPEA